MPIFSNLPHPPLKLPLDNAEVYYFDNFFNSNESKFLFEQLETTIEWRQENIKIFGKSIAQPRLTALYGDANKPYTYSGLTWQPLAWTEELKMIKQTIEEQVNVKFTTVLLNLYRHGQDSMGWHSDDEIELGKNPIIGSVSFGASRNFQFRSKADKKQKYALQLTNGSFLLMAGATQHYWQHQIPKTQKKVAPRINLTLRIIQ